MALQHYIERGIAMIHRLRGSHADIPRSPELPIGERIAAGTAAVVYTTPQDARVVTKRYCCADNDACILARHVWTATDPALLAEGLVPVISYAASDTTFDISAVRCDETIADHLRTADAGKIRLLFPRIVQQCASAHAAGYILNDVINTANILVRDGQPYWTDTENIRLCPELVSPDERDLNRHHDKLSAKYGALRLLEDDDPLPQQEDDIESLAVAFADLAYGIYDHAPISTAREIFCGGGMRRPDLRPLDEVLRQGIGRNYPTMQAFADDVAAICRQ